MMGWIQEFLGAHLMELQLAIEAAAIAVFLPLWLKTRKRYRRYSGGKFSPLTALLVVGVALGARSLMAMLVLLLLPFFPSYAQIEAQLSSGSFTVQLLALGILAPFAEEFCFRGVTLNRMENLRPWLAVLITSVIFGVAHLNVVQGVYAALYGAMLGFFCVRFRTIWYAVIAHISVNVTSVLLGQLPQGDQRTQLIMGLVGIASIALFFICGVFLLRRAHPPLPAPPEGLDPEMCVFQNPSPGPSWYRTPPM